MGQLVDIDTRVLGSNRKTGSIGLNNMRSFWLSDSTCLKEHVGFLSSVLTGENRNGVGPMEGQCCHDPFLQPL